MQTDPSGNLLPATKFTATLHTRRLVWLVEYNYSTTANTVKNTVNFSDGDWTDETDFVRGLSGAMQFFPVDDAITNIGALPPNSASVALRNPKRAADGGPARFSPNRSDSPLYTYLRMDSGAGGIYQLPTNIWIGFYDAPGSTPFTPTMLGAGIDATSTTALNLLDALNAGMIIRIDSEKIFLATGGINPARIVRGVDGTTPAAHSNNATVTIIGAMTPQFTGIVNTPSETSDHFTAQFQCLDRSAVLVQNAVTAPATAPIVLANSTVPVVLRAFLDALPVSPTFAPVPSGQCDFDSGIYLIPFAWIDDSIVYFECARVASVDGGLFFFNKSGRAQYWNGQHLLGATSVYTFDTLNMEDFSVEYQYNNIFTDVTTDYSSRTVGPQQVVYQLSESIIVPPATSVAYGTPKTFAAAITSTTSGSINCSATTPNGDILIAGGEQMYVVDGSVAATTRVSRGYSGTGNIKRVTTLNGAVDAFTTTFVIVGTSIVVYDTIIVQNEICYVTAVSTSTLTVTRGFADTTAAPHPSGSGVSRFNGSAHASGLSVTKVSTYGTFSTILQFQFPCTTITTPVGGGVPESATPDTRDLTAVSAGGTDIGQAISASVHGGAFTATAARASVTIVNANANSAAYVSKFQVRGTPLLGYPAKKVKVTNATVPTSLAKRTRQVASNYFWQDEKQANAVINYLADRWKTGRAIYHLQGVPGVPMLELGDLITITEPTALTAGKTAFVVAIRWRIDGLGKEPPQPIYKMDIDAVDSGSYYQSSAYYKVGTDKLNNAKVFYY